MNVNNLLDLYTDYLLVTPSYSTATGLSLVTGNKVSHETGQMTVSFHDRGNYQSFKKHLKKVLHDYRGNSKIIIVVDNVRFHHAKLLEKWLIKHPKLELVYLPPYSPELNPVKRAWWHMRKKTAHNRFMQTLYDGKAAFWKMSSHFQKPDLELLKICEINF